MSSVKFFAKNLRSFFHIIYYRAFKNFHGIVHSKYGILYVYNDVIETEVNVTECILSFYFLSILQNVTKANFHAEVNQLALYIKNICYRK
jgi:hypothetical protein